MNLAETFDAIESPEFAARLGIASSLETFLRIAKSQTQVTQLLNSLADLRAVNELASRIEQVLTRQFDREYLNPWDTAIALYLWALSTKDAMLARNYSERTVAELSSSLWWAQAVIEHLLTQQNAAGAVIVNPSTIPSPESVTPS